jgi:DNA topoisomerase-1
MILFGEALPAIRERVEQDLARKGMPREKILAAIVCLLEETHIRIGNEEYARTNNSYGLTTLQNEHVEVQGSTVHFQFRGKSGKDHAIDLRDKRLARIIKKCQELPGQELFEYVDENGQDHTVDSSDVNAYLKEITGQEFTAKDFRTWAGTILAARALSECESATSPTQCKKIVADVVKSVSQELGNTPAVCRKCYIHPAIIDSYTEGTLLEKLQQRAEENLARAVEETFARSAELRAEERAMMHLLRERLADETPKRQASSARHPLGTLTNRTERNDPATPSYAYPGDERRPLPILRVRRTLALAARSFILLVLLPRVA